MGCRELGPVSSRPKLTLVVRAQGQVGASVGGLDFIDREFILESIVDIAEESPIYSLRGCV